MEYLEWAREERLEWRPTVTDEESMLYQGLINNSHVDLEGLWHEFEEISGSMGRRTNTDSQKLWHILDQVSWREDAKEGKKYTYGDVVVSNYFVL